MQNSAVPLYCSNPRCQAPNLQSHNFCQKCRTPIIKRFLWALGKEIDAYTTGELLGDRYLLYQPRIVLDTKPSLPPISPPEISPAFLPYLKLSPYQLHIPQVYGLLIPTLSQQRRVIALLEEVPIYSGGTGLAQEGQLMPELSVAWKQAPALRQLNWLWQIAQLWQPMSSEGVASTLLMSSMLRVEGSIVRLLECVIDQQQTPTLSQLGKLWEQWLPEAHPSITKFLEKLCQQLIQGEVRNSEQLMALLEQGLADAGRSPSTQFQIFTRSDTGPSRRRNEDACYPPSGTPINYSQGTAIALTIVCDGIGGHEGGDVASHLAINAIQEQLQNLSSHPENLHPAIIATTLENAACTANDLISQRNDSEQRQERQRMGTTLVMALAHQHELYITHVGDSRAYRITRIGCHQVTLDDDLASREVRLGYSVYRDAVQQSGSGSLVQALGMGSSSILHPTVQRLIVDEDCVFLLCSDGLSDHDRVEQYWETEILPILDGQRDLATAGQRLVQLANQQNGHDNVTVALVYCQVKHPETTQQSEISVAEIPNSAPPPTPVFPTTSLQAASSQMKTQQLSPPRSASSRWGFLLGSIVVLGLLGGLAYGWFKREGDRPISIGASNPVTTPASTTPDTTSTTSNTLLQPGLFRELINETRAVIQPSQQAVKLPAKTIVQLQDKTTPENTWLAKVCSTPPTSPTSNASPQSLTRRAASGNPKIKPPPKTANPVANRPIKLGEVISIEEEALTSSSQPHPVTNSVPLLGCPELTNASPLPSPT